MRIEVVATAVDRAAPRPCPVGLGSGLREMGGDGEPELDRRRPELQGGRVRRVGRDPEANAVGERPGDSVAVGGEAGLHLVGTGPEHLEVHDRPETDLGTRRCGGPRVAQVAHGGDAGSEAFGCAEHRNRLHLLEGEPALPLDVDRDPALEVEPVGKAGIHRVLEVGVGVHETGQDRRALEMTLAASRPDLDDSPVLPGDVRVTNRGAVDGEHPVGGERGHVSSAASIRAARRSRNQASQIESSNRTRSGAASIAVVTGSMPGKATAMQATTK